MGESRICIDSVGRASVPARIDPERKLREPNNIRPQAYFFVRAESAPAGGHGCQPYGAIRFQHGFTSAWTRFKYLA